MHRGNQQAFFPFCKCHRRYFCLITSLIFNKKNAWFNSWQNKTKNKIGIQLKAAQYYWVNSWALNFKWKALGGETKGGWNGSGFFYSRNVKVALVRATCLICLLVVIGLQHSRNKDAFHYSDKSLFCIKRQKKKKSVHRPNIQGMKLVEILKLTGVNIALKT